MTVAVVVPVYKSAATLTELAERVAAALSGRPWRLRLVIDASPDESRAAARSLAAADARISVTDLPRNVGQHRALARGLADEPGASTWACLDADLQDPPEALPVLLDRLAQGDVDVVFAGRRGAYESAGRLATGRLHRAALARITGLPADAGAFLVMDGAGRDAVLALGGPSIVAALGIAGLPFSSVPVARSPRPVGTSAWTAVARVRHSARTLLWAAMRRRRAA